MFLNFGTLKGLQTQVLLETKYIATWSCEVSCVAIAELSIIHHNIFVCRLGGDVNEDDVRFALGPTARLSKADSAKEQADIGEKSSLIAAIRQRARTRSTLLQRHLQMLNTGMMSKLSSNRMAMCQGFLLRKIAVLDKIAELTFWQDANTCQLTF